jgi:hypothetical protein
MNNAIAAPALSHPMSRRKWPAIVGPVLHGTIVGDRWIDINFESSLCRAVN